MTKPKISKRHTTAYTHLLPETKNSCGILFESKLVLFVASTSELTQFCRLRASRLMGSRIIDVDDFIAELWQVHLKVKEEGYVQVKSISARKNKLAKNP